MKTILFQGDSITDCGRLRSDTDNFFVKAYNKFLKKTPLGGGYPSFVAEELKGDYIFVNRGVSGDRVPDVYARIVRDIIKVKPDVISILVGVNDIWHGFDWNNGTGIERYEKVYTMLVEELLSELPDTKIMLMEPFVLEGTATSNREGQPDRLEKFRNGIDDLSDIVKTIANKYNLIFIPLQKQLSMAAEKEGAKNILSDGVHPTAKGHEIIKNEWIKAFESIG